MNPYVKEVLVGLGVFVATMIVSAVTGIPFGPGATAYLVAAAVMFGLTFLLARLLKVQSFNDGMFRGSVWLMVALLVFLLLSVVSDNLAPLGEASFFAMLACIAGGPMLAGRLVDNGAVH